MVVLSEVVSPSVSDFCIHQDPFINKFPAVVENKDIGSTIDTAKILGPGACLCGFRVFFCCCCFFSIYLIFFCSDSGIFYVTCRFGELE